MFKVFGNSFLTVGTITCSLIQWIINYNKTINFYFFVFKSFIKMFTEIKTGCFIYFYPEKILWSIHFRSDHFFSLQENDIDSTKIFHFYTSKGIIIMIIIIMIIIIIIIYLWKNINNNPAEENSFSQKVNTSSNGWPNS